jgi:hypothetical protein
MGKAGGNSLRLIGFHLARLFSVLQVFVREVGLLVVLMRAAPGRRARRWRQCQYLLSFHS